MASEFERLVRSQPDELDRVLTDPTVKEQAHAAAEGLHRVRRIWVVGTGSSQHAAALGAAMLQDAGRSAHSVSSMQFVKNAPIVGGSDGVVVVTHTGDTAYATAARALAFTAGLHTVTVTHRGIGMNDVVETVDREASQTSSVGYTSSLMALAMIASAMGADSLVPDKLALVPGSVRNALEAPGIDGIPAPRRSLVFVGAGPASTTAAEGALKAREAARILATGFDAEYFLHGCAAALGDQDHVVALTTPDEDGFVGALADVAGASGLGVSRVSEPAPLPAVLAQIPLTARLQMLALSLATARGTDPDTVFEGPWSDHDVWKIGSPIS